ncbi:magnesium transporter CorA family protein [Candidatus Lokiarchaeum ossiferum]|uniref:magnesium transporter CorA family protein n=1 Tax=Candidatus Lokiarchaeum ossiferum TaxID=2951803 RepID=UPI00352D3813
MAKMTYYIVRDVIEKHPVIETCEVSLEDLRGEFNIEAVKKQCQFCFLDVFLEDSPFDLDHNQEILDLTVLLDISLDTFEEIIQDSRPRLDDYQEYLFILFKSIGKHPTEIDGKSEHQCGLIIDENVLMSIHVGIPLPLEKLFRLFNRNPQMLIRGGITYLSTTYFDALIDPTYHVLDGWRKLSDDIEWSILSQKRVDQQTTLSRLIGIRESIFDTVKILQADREVVNRMKSPNMPIFKKEFIPPELDDHIRHLLDEQDILRATISDLMNLFFNAESSKTNRVLSRYTFVTSILLLPSLIAGIFGMNNIHFPQISFWWVLVIMVSCMGGLWFLFKKKQLI